MHQNVIGKNVRVTDNVKKHIAAKMQKIKHYADKIIDANVVCEHIHNDYIVEVTLIFGKKVFHAKETNKDLYNAIDSLFIKIEREIEKIKDKDKDYRVKAETPEIENQYDVEIESVFHKPIDEVEAILQLEAARKNFFAYFPIDQTEDLYNIKVGKYPVFLIKNDKEYAEVAYNENEDAWFIKNIRLTDDKHIIEMSKKEYNMEERTASQTFNTLSQNTDIKYYVYMNAVINRVECIYRGSDKKFGIIRILDF